MGISPGRNEILAKEYGHNWMEATRPVRGKIQNTDRKKQIVDYSGLTIGKITPTDMDGLIEYHGKLFVFIELKTGDAEMPQGQQIALEQLCDALTRPALLIVCEHNTPCDKEVDAANAKVRKYYSHKEWHIPEQDIKLKALVDSFISRYGA